jgi:hypothetical protein
VGAYLLPDSLSEPTSLLCRRTVLCASRKLSSLSPFCCCQRKSEH